MVRAVSELYVYYNCAVELYNRGGTVSYEKRRVSPVVAVASICRRSLTPLAAYLGNVAVVVEDRTLEFNLADGRLALEARPARGELSVGEADAVGVAGARGDHRVLVDLA